MLNNTYELSATGFLAAAAVESRRLAGHVRMFKTAKANGNHGGMRLALRRANESAQRMENLLEMAAMWAEMDTARRNG